MNPSMSPRITPNHTNRLSGRLTLQLAGCLAGIALSATWALNAQAPQSAWDGVYTMAQAERGKAVYGTSCAGCHGGALQGGDETPPLAGGSFMANWNGQSAGDLLAITSATMPAGQPGSLTSQQYADVLAYIFNANHLPAGTQDLSADSKALQGVRLETERGSGAGSQPTATAASAAGSPAALVEGQPIEMRPPEKRDNKPTFPQQTRAPYRKTAPYKITTLVDDLPVPWSVAFLPGGKILFTERLPGSIRLLDKNGTVSGPIAGVKELSSPKATMMGVLDVMPDPDYANNHEIFFTFYDVIDGTNTNTYAARARLDEAGPALRDAKVIFRAKPDMPSKRLGGKTGGRIAFAPDGTLFFPIGDRSDSPPWNVAQELDNHLGKILHITKDGKPAPDNPFLGQPGVLPEIWAYGMRSQEGMAFDPKTGRLWEHEHGARGGDELNIVEKGKNYGWPIVTHGIDYPGGAIGAGITHKDGMVDPVYYWDPVIAPSGLAFYQGTLFPEWQGSLFVGGLRGQVLSRLKIVNDKVVEEEPLLTELNSRIRDVRVGPDGAVYVLTDSGTPTTSPDSPRGSKLLKLTPQ
jgi:glucose/arabinose dehydrogenase/mono/diheme cytochrome c family protein